MERSTSNLDTILKVFGLFVVPLNLKPDGGNRTSQIKNASELFLINSVLGFQNFRPRHLWLRWDVPIENWGYDFKGLSIQQLLGFILFVFHG